MSRNTDSLASRSDDLIAIVELITVTTKPPLGRRQLALRFFEFEIQSMEHDTVMRRGNRHTDVGNTSQHALCFQLHCLTYRYVHTVRYGVYSA